MFSSDPLAPLDRASRLRFPTFQMFGMAGHLLLQSCGTFSCLSASLAPSVLPGCLAFLEERPDFPKLKPTSEERPRRY